MSSATDGLALAGLLLASTAAAAGACTAGEHRQFDFWPGEWNVRAPDDKLAGVNTFMAASGPVDPDGVGLAQNCVSVPQGSRHED